MNHLAASIALVRHPVHLEQQWLSYWNAGRYYYDFVTAERLEGESYRYCLDRELAWVLRVRQGKDYLISSQARLHLELDSDSELTETFAVVEFYVVDLFGESVRTSVKDNQQLRWLSGDEVLAGQTFDGSPLNPNLVKLLQKADVIARYPR